MPVKFRSNLKKAWRIILLSFALIIMGQCGNFDGQGGILAPLLLNSLPVDPNAGFDIQVSTAVLTSESGTTFGFTLALKSEPRFSVIITPTSTDTGEGVPTARLEFTPTNWSTPQTVTVTGVDDVTADGNQFYSIDLGLSSSADPSYSFVPVGTVSALNTDDESPGVTITPLTGLATSETLTTATFLIVLNNQPTANVPIDVTSGDTSEGTVSPAMPTFTTANWNTPQTITVTGVNDFLNDGSINYTISFAVNAASTDPVYTPAFTITDQVSVTNSDDDTPGITVTPTAGLSLNENAGTDTFTVVLNSQPTASVNVPTITSSDTTAGTVAPAALTFTTGNWNVPQTVTITGVDDFYDDGTQTTDITLAAATSADLDYNGMAVADVTSVSVLDNDTAGIFVTPTTGLLTTESAGTATFTVVLTSRPTANVVMNLSSSDTLEATVSPATLTFTNANWNIAQTVTVTGVDDAIPVVDGAVAYTIVIDPATSTDPLYNNMDPSDVTGSNSNNDNAAFTITPVTDFVTTESGGTATFNVRLATQPAASVTLGRASDLIRSLDTTEGTTSHTTLTFTTANWNVDQLVTVTGVSDAGLDANTAYHIDLGTGSSTDPIYDNLAPPDSNGGTAGELTFNNCDTQNQTGYCLLPGVSALTTTEAGGNTRFGITLKQSPTASVSMNITSNDTTEFTVSTGSLSFTSADWNTIKWVTLTGVNDFEDDGNITSSVDIAALVSGDGFYSGYDPANPSVTNNDNDTSGFTISGISGNTTELLGTATFTVRLNSRPTGNVTFPLQSNDTTEGTVSPASLTFTNTGGSCGGGGDWCTNQTVTVTGVNDATVDGNITFQIVNGPGNTVSTDANYNNMSPLSRNVTNVNNDRFLFITTTGHNGDYDNDATYAGAPNGAVNADGNGINEADNYCMSVANGYPNDGRTYRAMIVDGVNRTASPALDWVLTANYDYYRLDSTFVFSADASAIFTFGAFTNSPGTSGTYRTGLLTNWGTSTDDCNNWTGSAALSATAGDGTAINSDTISQSTLNCSAATRGLLCVHQ